MAAWISRDVFGKILRVEKNLPNQKSLIVLELRNEFFDGIENHKKGTKYRRCPNNHVGPIGGI